MDYMNAKEAADKWGLSVNTEFHSVAARSPTASEGWNKSFHPIVFGATVKQRSPGS